MGEPDDLAEPEHDLGRLLRGRLRRLPVPFLNQPGQVAPLDVLVL